MINAQHPDLILIGGDLVDRTVVPLYSENMLEELNQLNAPLGIYMVPGNHEYYAGIQKCIEYVKHTGIQLLMDSVVTLPNGIQLIGRDDKSNPRRKSLKQLRALTDPSKPTILIDHQPYRLEETEKEGIDLQFSGHTHEGQVWPLSLATDKIFDQSYGYRKWGDSQVYVSSGFSLWGPPFRIGTDSEMIVFMIK
jgi:predicted MPP superfamily phosphohydrolase